MPRINVLRGALVVTLVGSAAALGAPDHAYSDGCNDYEDWLENDVFFDDHYHQADGAAHPEVAYPDGEWEFVQAVEDRRGEPHMVVYPMYTDESGEHSPCGTGGTGS